MKAATFKPFYTQKTCFTVKLKISMDLQQIIPLSDERDFHCFWTWIATLFGVQDNKKVKFPSTV